MYQKHSKDSDMPLYSFECERCKNITDKTFQIEKCPKHISCICGGDARKVIVNGHGGIQTDGDVTWLASAAASAQRQHERPVETRTEYKKYLKDNDLIQCG